jgi:hypothetical protein
MYKALAELVEHTVTAAQLPAPAQHELREELLSHINAQVTDLQFQGYKDSDIINLIQQSFGDTQIIGKQLFRAPTLLSPGLVGGSIMYCSLIYCGCICHSDFK